MPDRCSTPALTSPDFGNGNIRWSHELSVVPKQWSENTLFNVVGENDAKLSGIILFPFLTELKLFPIGVQKSFMW